MEEYFGSESSSGCESGWTVYLEHSSHSTHKKITCKKESFTHEIDDEDDDEDMSMVSDASSGPQHFPEHEDECFKLNNNVGVYTNGKRQKIPKEADSQKQIHGFLDDTASSPLFNFSNNNLSKKALVPENQIVDYSQGYSTTYFKRKSSAFQDHLGFFHPVSGTQRQQNHLR